jgi:murein DD-endopeptidase MepM/ murein hydrolase activator NlpD
VATVLAATATPGAGPRASARPGTVVRWPGEGLEWCEVGGRRFPPLDGACVYPVDLLRAAGPLELARGRTGRRETTTLHVGRFDYPIQKLTLPPHMVELSPEDLARVERENREMARLWSREGPRRFTLPLGAPLDPLPQGGRFGHRRIINGRPRSPHGGRDYSAADGTPVLAAADGEVAMVADQFFGGNAVFIDHGDGLVSMYMHMSRVDVAEGQAVLRGGRVGAVGSTGRATGPHLHFGVRWHGARVDPALLLGKPEAFPAVE